MNILIVSEVFYPEDFHVNDFAKSLVARGHHVKVMTRQPSYPMGFVFPGYKNERHSVEKWGEIEIHRFDVVEGYRDSKIKKIANYFHFVRRGQRVISEIIGGTDLIIVYQTGPLSLALPAIYAKKKFNIPVIVWSFDLWPDTVYMYGFPQKFPITTTVNYVINKVYKNADAIMVGSRQFADTIKQYVPTADITYAPNWQMQPETQPTALPIDTSKTNFVFAGNISKAQNLEYTIRGFVEAKCENAVLNIVGDGSFMPWIEHVVQELGCKNVILHGRVPYAEVPSILDKCDVLILSLTPRGGIDKTEPFKLQTYLQSGKPVFGIIRGAGQEIIESNGIGICSDPNDVKDIARGFKQMMQLSDADKDRISSAAKTLMETRFCKEKVMQTIGALMERVCKK